MKNDLEHILNMSPTFDIPSSSPQIQIVEEVLPFMPRMSPSKKLSSNLVFSIPQIKSTFDIEQFIDDKDNLNFYNN